MTIEAVFSAGVAAIIECQTESKAKTLMEVRTILTKHSGSQSPVQFLFKRKGVVCLSPLPKGVTVDAVTDCALEVEGFEDIDELEDEGRGGVIELLSEPNAVKAIADAVTEKLGVEIDNMEILWQPVDLVDASPENTALIENAVAKIKDITEVQQVYLNMRRGEAAPT